MLSHGLAVRALIVLVPVVLSAALGLGLVTSCDTGGEPPGGADAAGDSPVTDTSNLPDTHTPPTDGRTGDVVSTDGPATEDVACGLSGNACCKGEVTPCARGTSCIDHVCQGPCGEPGMSCCAGNTCKGSTAVCASGVCTACGEPGDPPCALNLCHDGGCNMGGFCAAEGTRCSGTDGGVCAAGGCGSCGSPGQACCISGCTAPETVCEGEVTVVDSGGGSGSSDEAGGEAGAGGGGRAGGSGGSPGQCAACGGAGQYCCSGSSCSGTLTCGSSGRCLCSGTSCGDEPDASGGG
jgi:hypothetical protein